eukprot:TRINITY_DN2808_c3_g1_i1.p1 TRINITY_DN2808_c3_g1~~TRINITY_DN2808_c3_g1_i1.p1  ORF type:complete len:769 (+),score=283.24 TRINITY_DN2808_c3_g1_i1:64-2370(+)
MPGKKQKAKERLDKFYDLAKTMGYRSRAAFKLTQLNKKYDFLGKAKTLVDLCAAPGSWSQVAAKEMPASSTIIAVDLVKIAPLRGVKTLVGDIMTDKTRSQIKAMLDKRRCEVVVHDGAPNVGGTWAKDAYNQNLLTLKACKLACELLLPDGWFVTKVFRSTDSERLVWVFKQLFEKVEKFKPAASRQQSAEVFIVCAGYKAPKKLDANLFSAKTVFEMIDDGQVVDKTDPTHQSKRVDTSYPEGKMLLYEKVGVEDFLSCEDPKQFLQIYNEIIWDGSEELLEHKTTNNDVKECFKDLKVISKWDQNKLIKWAKGINRERQDLARDIRAADKEAERLGAEHVEEDDNDPEKIMKEIADMHKRQDKAKKRAEQKMINRKLNEAGKLGYNPEEQEACKSDFYEFSKSDLTNVAADINEDDYDGNADIGLDTEIAGLDIHRTDHQGRDMVMDVDSGDEEDEEEDDMEEERIQKGITPKEQQALTTGDYYKSIERVFNNAYRNREDYESDEAISDEDEASDTGVEKWIYTSEEGDSSTDDDEDSDSIAQERAKKVRKTETKSDAATDPSMTVQQAMRSDRLQKTKAKKKKRAPSGFEEIPTEMRDPEVRARTLAIAQQMLEGKRRKREILEDGIHRYCHGSSEGLPQWFVDDEKRHHVRPLPVTKDEVEAHKARFKEIDARPAKKVAEAVARRRKRASDKLRRILVKEKSDPRLKGTSERLTVRKLMRGKELRRKKENKAQDGKSMAEDRLAKKKAKLSGKHKKAGGKRKK